MMDATQELIEARSYALRLIKFRARSEKEIRDKFAGKDYSQETIEAVVDVLKKQRFLDDRLFAKLWVESRIKRSLGVSRLRYELVKKGVAAPHIEEALDGIRDNYDEKTIIREIIARKSGRMKRLSCEKKRSRLFGYLVRRGYPKGLVIEMILDYCQPEKNEISES